MIGLALRRAEGNEGFAADVAPRRPPRDVPAFSRAAKEPVPAPRRAR
jgi:hypothetical protein